MADQVLEINWCLWDWATSSDFLICNWFDDALPDLYNQDNIIFEYNQNNQSRSKKSCTIFSAVWAISDLFNYEFSLDEIKEIDEISYSRWRFKDNWRWVQSAVKLVADWWNANQKLVSKYWKVAYYRISTIDDKLVSSILDKWYNIMTNINWNTKYQLDYLKDAIVNWTKFWAATYWHALNLVTINLKKIDWVVCVKDNYKWRVINSWKEDCNIYSLEHYPSEISVFWSNWYIYTKVKEDNFKRVYELNEFKTLLIQTIANNSAMRHKSRDVNYQKKLNEMNNANRKKLDDIDEQLKLLA